MNRNKILWRLSIVLVTSSLAGCLPGSKAQGLEEGDDAPRVWDHCDPASPDGAPLVGRTGEACTYSGSCGQRTLEGEVSDATCWEGTLLANRQTYGTAVVACAAPRVDGRCVVFTSNEPLDWTSPLRPCTNDAPAYEISRCLSDDPLIRPDAPSTPWALESPVDCTALHEQFQTIEPGDPLPGDPCTGDQLCRYDSLPLGGAWMWCLEGRLQLVDDSGF